MQTNIEGNHARRMPVGAEPGPDGSVHFRVWAPKRNRVEVVLEGNHPVALGSDEPGYFSGLIDGAKTGTRYRFRLDSEETLYPDPVSRFQPEGPHGPSEVIDPGSFSWTDSTWMGMTQQGQIIYEMHLGTFTREGTWTAAQQQLPELAALGITCIELMPIADFPGRYGWGYDGVDMFAPAGIYGTPDDARRFINEAHHFGVAVILDVVYNHFGPDGNYIQAFTSEYFTKQYKNDWGEAINFSSPGTREFYKSNAAYWINEFHFDGLRLDATQDINDSSSPHILREISEVVRKAGGSRHTYLVAENEPQNTRLVRSVEDGGYGLDALWNDDFHHSALVAMTGRNEAYYTDYLGAPQEFISAAKYGYLYQGQWYKWQKKRRGSPALNLLPWNFVTFLQNHDQVANSAHGDRPNILASPGTYRAMSALLLLGPCTPMLFQGQEFGSSSKFLFFCDHNEDLCQKIHEGRNEFLAQFRSLSRPEMQQQLVDPGDSKSFETCILDFSEREKNAHVYGLYRDLIRLRREDTVFGAMQESRSIDGAVLSTEAFVLRYFGEDDDRLLIVNLGKDLHLHPAPEPLLAPLPGTHWDVLWSSENPKYGGTGTYPPDSEQNWRIPAQSALVLQPMLGPASGVDSEAPKPASESSPTSETKSKEAAE